MKNSTTGKLALRFTSAIIRFILNIIFYILVVVMVTRGATYIYNFSYQVFGSVAKDEAPGTDVPVQIYRGETTMNIATKLETSLIIVNKYSFSLKTRLKKYNIMPGTYILNTSMDYNEILEIITDSSNSIAAEESLEDAEAGITGNNGSAQGDEASAGDEDGISAGKEDGTPAGDGADE